MIKNKKTRNRSENECYINLKTIYLLKLQILK